MSLPDNTHTLPMASRAADADACMAQLLQADALKPLLAAPHHHALVEAAAGNSSYLARLMVKYPLLLAEYLAEGMEASWARLVQQRRVIDPTLHDLAGIMRALREAKAQSALVIALADISGGWNLAQVTQALSDLAEDAVTLSLRFLLQKAVARGELRALQPERPESGSGIILLGMGKLGAFELNYSSDIDLILLFDKDTLPYSGARNAQVFMNKLGSDLVQLLQERTRDGYVFRTDLRLRPDPMSTPLAVSTAAALTYYETVGQNWERAAMIKARPIAGDDAASEAFLKALRPFIWRKALDFATIADIHSIKRQMNVHGKQAISLPRHNIKRGIGGIREIEFFVVTQQLVWGGRLPALRVRGTLEALDLLSAHDIVASDTRDQLRAAYNQLRHVEHRLQMRADEQTHSLPADAETMREVALFSGFRALDVFETTLLATLSRVHAIYRESMVDTTPLAVDGNLMFTGVEADADTLMTLQRLGYREAQRVSDIIQGWHRGHRRSTRSRRSRELLTELVPALLTSFGKTANPDTAFFHFDDFISRLPSGAQIFSLLASRPELLGLLADMLGSAPALGETLGNNPALLESVFEPDFFLDLLRKDALEDIVTERLRYAEGFEQKMGFLRIFNNEKRFQAGVHLLKRLATPKRIGTFLSDLAEIILQCTMREVWAHYQQAMSDAPDTIPFAIVGFGKLGGREMTFGSDLDLVFLYDDGGEAASENRMHLARISQRLVNALSLLTREGRLYLVDTRLRPGGADGPLAVSLAAFDAYFTHSAWTYEHLALTRARVVAANDPAFMTAVEATIRRHVLKSRDATRLQNDISEMRERIAREHKTVNPWALKQVRGGMIDLDFIAQYLVLRYGADHPEIWHRSARRVFETVQTLGLIDDRTAMALVDAKKFLTDLMCLLRLSAPGGIITDDAPGGLKELLIHAMRAEDFETLKTQLLSLENDVARCLENLMESGVPH